MSDVGFLNSVKSHFKNSDEAEEEEFERAFREGRFPDDVDFEPLSNTGNFVATGVQPEEPTLPDSDEGLERMGMGTEVLPPAAPASQGQSQQHPQQVPPELQGATWAPQGYGQPRAPQAAPVPVGQAVRPAPVTAARPGQPGRPAGAPQGRPRPAAPNQGRAPQGTGAVAPYLSQNAPAGSAAPRPLSSEGGVQVFEREGGRSTRTTPPRTEPFADRLRARVAAANVSGVIDDGLGRSHAAVDGPSVTGSGKVVRPSGPAQPRRDIDVRNDDLEAELAARRRERRASASAPARSDAPAPRRTSDSARSAAPASRRPASEPLPPRERPSSTPAAEHRPAPQPRPAAPESDAVEPFKLPTTPIVLRPRVYDDVSQVAAGVISHHQPVVLVLRGSSAEVARRIMDFSFGLCCGTGAQMEQLDDRVYAVMPRGTTIGDPDIAALRRQGVLRG
ncbi:MAG: cell division protein SepF [Coriobacteriia bacterium]|nr:cell division protein SepF [Coriobacteriia bacterium]